MIDRRALIGSLAAAAVAPIPRRDPRLSPRVGDKFFRVMPSRGPDGEGDECFCPECASESSVAIHEIHADGSVVMRNLNYNVPLRRLTREEFEVAASPTFWLGPERWELAKE